MALRSEQFNREAVAKYDNSDRYGREVGKVVTSAVDAGLEQVRAGLANSSQAESADDRAARRADRLRRKLGWQPGILNGPGLKPKGMHQRTYERLVAQHDDFVGVSLAGMARKLGLLRGQLDDIEDAAASRR